MPNISLKKLWRRKSATITEYDPTYKVIYLGNVLTGWAKGDGCVEKPLATLWRNYCQSNRPDIVMKVTICGAGLKAVTKEHGLTEYWAHRVTYCAYHPAYPRVFCWVYRHEGRRLKQELRCHAVLCPKQDKAETMASKLKARLSASLQEFKREKIIRQNARLSLVHAVYDSASLPLRKIYLITGASNYRPPLERSKSAPKLGAIEEIIEEEEEEEEEINEVKKEWRDATNVVDTVAQIGVELKGGVSGETPAAEETSLSISEDTSDVNLDLDSGSEAASTLQDTHFLSEEEEESPLTNDCGYSVEMNFSSPDLLFYKVSPVSVSIEKFNRDICRSKSPTVSIPESAEIELLTSFQEKLVLRHGRDESLTSDQPESIGSHSCNSSCETCSGNGRDIHLTVDCEDETPQNILKNPISSLKKDPEEESDNISEESGYSEDKDCLMAARVKTV